MEYLIFAFVMGAFALVIIVMEVLRTKREDRMFVEKLYKNYDSLRQKKYNLERYARMGSFFDRHREDGQLDDITWNDLGMDEIFKRMNYTLSASGEEYLYYTLRTLRQKEEELIHLEEVVRFFGEHPDLRVQVQLVMNRLGYTGKFSLYDYMDNLELLGERSNRKNILMDLLFVPCIGMLWVNFSVGILGIVLLIIVNIMSYFREKAQIDPYITSFSYVMRLYKAGGELEKLSVPVCGGEWEQMRRARRGLQGMKRNSFWVMSPFRGNSSGDILAIFLDYVRMVFHADLIKFNSMLRVLRGHMGDVDALVQVVGYLETAIAIWEFRQSLEAAQASARAGADRSKWPKTAAEKDAQGPEAGSALSGQNASSGCGWCVPVLGEGEYVDLKEVYHPLITDPVKNGIRAERGVLLTGSNASGKSTFLKTVALNAVPAQSIHTCTADVYRAGFFQVYSSMALRDDLESGESYYIVEIKALKRILDAAAGQGHILCFVDEVLRGTNTVERIAASTQILKSLGGKGILCFAATHDIELTELLEREYDNYHFEEDVRDGDVYFNYRIQPGRATTRNAIKLLELMGYAPEIIERAAAQAERFVTSGQWNFSSSRVPVP